MNAVHLFEYVIADLSLFSLLVSQFIKPFGESNIQHGTTQCKDCMQSRPKQIEQLVITSFLAEGFAGIKL